MGRCKFYIKVKKTQNNCNNHKKADSRKNWDMTIKSWYDHFFIRSPVANFLPNIRLFPCSWKHLSINLLTTKLPIWNKVNYSAISFCLENNVLSKITKQQSTNNFLVSIACFFNCNYHYYYYHYYYYYSYSNWKGNSSRVGICQISRSRLKPLHWCLWTIIILLF